MAINVDTGLVKTDSNSPYTHHDPNGNVIGSGSTSYWKKYTRDFAQGSDTPHFYRRKRAGLLIPYTTWGQGKLTYDAQASTSRTDEHSGYYSVHSNVMHYQRPWDGDDGIAAYLPAPDTEYVSAYVQAAAASIYSKGWDALTFTGELPSLRRMFKRTSSKIVNLARGHSSKRVLDLWLEGRYGYRTLAYDIRDLHNAVNDWDSDRKIHTERKGFSQHKSWEYSTTKRVANFTFNVDERITSSFSLRGSVAASIDIPRVIIDPLKTGWELIPYSFVLDWVIGVGQALDAYRFMQMQTAYTAAHGIKATHKYELDVSSAQVVPNTSTKTVSYPGCSAEATYEKVTRTPTSVSYNPQQTGRLIDGSLGLDLIALSRTRARF